ncbi:MAG: exodeoxyribonuclease V subunit gamma, partial [Bacteroidota bacterium]
MPDRQLDLPFAADSPLAATRRQGVAIVTSTDLGALFDRLAHRMEQDPLPPYQAEVVCLPHRTGLRAWLEQQLARRHGCCASLHTPTLRELADSLIRKTSDDGSSNALEGGALTWRLFAFLGSLPPDPQFDPLRTYLRRVNGDAMPLARRLASLFETYQTYRPDVLDAWRDNRDVPKNWPNARWQAALWRYLVSDSTSDRGTRLHQLIDMLRAPDIVPAGLPPRLSILGELIVPPAVLPFIEALAIHIPITWYAVLPGAGEASHPLADVLGREARLARELWRGLPSAKTHVAEASAGSHEKTALAVLQDDIRSGRTRRPEDRLLLSPDDASLRIHDCHAPVRELEVLRDQLLDAFETIDGLEPSEIVVIVPDLDRYATLIDAAFSSGDEEMRLPFRVARDPREDGRRYLHAFGSLLDLLTSRLPAGAVLELLSEPAVRLAADLSAEDLDVVRGWIRTTNVHWGADARHKSEFAVPPSDLHTWHHGLNRLLMGVVAGDTAGIIDGILPHAEATLDRAELLGRFSLRIQDLMSAVSDARTRRSLADWSTWLRQLAQHFLAARSENEQKAEDYLLRELRELGQLDTLLGQETVVEFAAVRVFLAEILGRFEGPGQVLSGSITVTDFERLQHVPARVIACVGLNDDVFPRGTPTADFDVIPVDPRPGDPDPRRRDKQLFLDALLAARERLILTFNGRSQKDNSERAPSVVLDALLETCLRTFSAGEDDAAADAKAVRDHFVVQHPLQ